MSLSPPREKILDLEQAVAWRGGLRSEGKTLVVTNGCFDILHRGHVEYLFTARSFGDALLVGLNSDASVRELKGDGRPVNDEYARALLLAGFYFVDAVTVFDSLRCDSLLDALRPDVYVKGGDYDLSTMDPGERAVLERHGAKIEFVDFVPGFSTTGILEKASGKGGA
jgi:D-beta-D-heptose 7-phosphate kinase/D-beta-D-heptose 1-phosphate adenosyltransferase